MRGFITMASAAFALSACASVAQQDAPAVLTSHSSQAHAELVSVISAALNVATVTIADEALTRESVLIIERAPARDATGQRLSGRDFEKPEQFQLVKNGGRCVLVHVRTGQRYQLTRGRCKDEKK